MAPAVGAAYFLEIVQGPIGSTAFYGRRDAFHNVIVWRSAPWKMPEGPLKAKFILDELWQAAIGFQESYTHEN